MDMTGLQICKTADLLAGEEGNYRDLCDRVAQQFWPEDEFLTETSDGSEIDQPIDSFAIECLTALINGLTSNTMSMDKGNIIDSDNKLMEIPLVKDWYGELSTRTEHHMEQTQFGVFFQKWLHEYCAYGAGVMYIQFDPNTNEHDYLIYPIKDTHYTLNAKNMVHSVFRDYEYTAEQAVEQFGIDKLNPKIVQAYNDQDVVTKFKFVHAFYPRRNYNPESISSTKMKYASVHVFKDDGSIVRTSGSNQFRYVIKHFYQKNGERNGRSPCMQALPAARTLMKAVADVMDGIENGILPPTFISDRNAVETATLEAGAVNYCDMTKGQPWMMTPEAAFLQYAMSMIERMQSEIENLLFVPLFRTLMDRGSPQMTAFQTAELDGERVQALAPIANTLSAFFELAIKVIALDLVEHGQIDAPPADIDVDNIQVKYTSRLDVRLKQVETSAVQQAIGVTAEMNAMLDQSPATDAVYHRMEIGIAVADSHGVPPKLVRNLTEAKKEYDAILQAAQQAQQAEQAASMIKPMDPNMAPQEGSPMGSIEQAAGGMVGV